MAIKNPKTPPVIDFAQLASLPEDHPMNEKLAACYVGLSVHTLRQWRFKGIGPDYQKLGKAIRYTRQTLDAYKAKSSVRPMA